MVESGFQKMLIADKLSLSRAASVGGGCLDKWPTINARINYPWRLYFVK